MKNKKRTKKKQSLMRSVEVLAEHLNTDFPWLLLGKGEVAGQSD